MSFSLRMAPGLRRGTTLDVSLKIALEAWFERVGQHDALHRGIEIESGTELCGYIRGLAYCEVKGARALLDLLASHDTISLWLE